MLNITARSNILQANDQILNILISQTDRARLEFAHNWATRVESHLEKGLAKVTRKFFQQLTHSTIGVGRTSPLASLPGGTTGATLQEPWVPLTEKWMKRKRQNKKSFFLNTGTLKGQLKGMSWADKFGNPEVEAVKGSTSQSISVLVEGVRKATDRLGRTYHASIATGRRVTITSSYKTAIQQKQHLKIRVDYTPLLDSFDSSSNNPMVEAVIGGDAKLGYKLHGPSGRHRPLIAPFAEWYLNHKLPNKLKELVEQLETNRGFV